RAWMSGSQPAPGGARFIPSRGERTMRSVSRFVALTFAIELTASGFALAQPAGRARKPVHNHRSEAARVVEGRELARQQATGAAVLDVLARMDEQPAADRIGRGPAIDEAG